MIKLSDYVMRFVAEQKVRHVFLLPGGGCMHLVDSLGKNKKIGAVCNLHEQAAAIAADAYSQYTGNLGVALVTTGPGSTNAITGVTASWIDSTPVLVLSGQVKRADMIGKSGVRQMGVQEVDIIPIVRPVTKYAVTVMDPIEIRYHLEKALFLAKSGRPGPVWLAIPLDVQAALIDERKLKGFKAEKRAKRIDGRKIRKVMKLISLAERPIILAGNGIRLGGAQKEFFRLIERLNIPVLTTWRADDFLPETHRLYCGRPGAIGQRGANFAQQNSDLIITIGARLDFGQIGFDHGNFSRKATKVIVDIDPAEIGKLKTKVELPIVADAKVFLNAMLKLRLPKLKEQHRSWLRQCLVWKKRYPVVTSRQIGQKRRISTYAFIGMLSDLLTSRDVLIPDSSGSAAEVTQQAIRIKKGLRVLNSPGLGSMGFGLPAGIGACLASGRKRTIVIMGDGGLQLSIQELETVVRLQLPLKIFVLNNNGYASIQATQKRFFTGHLVCSNPASGLTLPDSCRIAEAYKIKHSCISTQKDLKRKLKRVLKTSGPVICELMIDPRQETVPRMSSYVKPDGSMASRPFEDLYPFLPRDEFCANSNVKPSEGSL